MASRRVEAEIDRLYQLAPDAFVAARNALAKDAGADAPEVRALAKPAVAAWAVNQLYWSRRELYDALIEASKELRQVHKAVLAGKRGDLRTAGKVHEDALETALKAVLGILKDAGHPAADATRQAALTTLRALPSDEPAGRLTRALQPGGFEMLAGLSIGGGQKASFHPKAEATKAEAAKPEIKPAKGAAKQKIETRDMTPAEKRAQQQALSRAREAAAKADRELRAAEHTAQREEFEAARAAREAEKAVKQIELAREAVEAAQQQLETAKAASVAAARVRDAAERRSKEAQRAVDAARGRHAQAADTLSAGRSSAQG